LKKREVELEAEISLMEGIVTKLGAISTILTGENLIRIKSVPDITIRIVEVLWSQNPETFISEDDVYFLCKGLYVENKEVVGYIKVDPTMKKEGDVWEEYIMDIKEQLNNSIENINHIVDSIKYIGNNKIRIVFDLPCRVYDPDFTDFFYKLDSLLYDCASYLERESERVESKEELVRGLLNSYSSITIKSFITDFLDLSTYKGDEIENELARILIKRIRKIPYTGSPYITDRVYPTEVAYQICKALRKIQGGVV